MTGLNGFKQLKYALVHAPIVKVMHLKRLLGKQRKEQAAESTQPI